jgi:hypothetical protein
LKQEKEGKKGREKNYLLPGGVFWVQAECQFHMGGSLNMADSFLIDL